MRFATVFLGVCFLACAALRDARAETPTGTDDVLRAAREASGAPYRYHLVSRSRERVGGIAYDVTSESEGSRFLIRRCSERVCNGLYVDGERSSTLNINDTALPLPIDVDPLQSSLRAVATGAFTAPEFAATGGRIEREADGTLEGARVQRLVVSTAHGAPLDVSIDAATHLVRSVATQGGKFVFAFAKYRKVDDLTLPFEIDVDGKRNQVFDRRSKAGGPLLAPGGLVPRTDGAAPAQLAAAAAPIVRCSIGSMTFSCLMDTGNSGMAMSPELASRLGLRPRGSAALRSFGGPVTGVVRAPELRVAGATYPAANYVVVRDLHASGADVALGADAFAHALVTIDYPARRLTIAPESRIENGLSLTFENFVPITGVGIGTLVVPIAIDTGTTDAIAVPLDFATSNRALITSPSTRANGDVTGSVGPVRLGGYAVRSATLDATHELPAQARGHLGSALLRHFRVDFDYAHERMRLAPVPGDASVRTAS